MKTAFAKWTAALLLFPALNASADTACRDVFFGEQSAAVKKLVGRDAFGQWMNWEQKANLAKFQKPTTTVEVPLVAVPASEILIQKTADAPQALLNTFMTQQGQILWPKHPYNQSSKVPYFHQAAQTSIPVYETSSRSLVATGALRGFTIKLATDHPHGPNGEYQPSKLKTEDDVDSALIHTNHLNKIDNAFGKDEKLLLLGEVMTLEERSTGIGMVVRDVRLLDDGHYYLPALSIPYIGRQIAELNGQSFEEFFEKTYGALLGEVKARLLLRTGLQMLTPNPQNMLIQLDRNLRPTGKMVLRDISDAYLVDVVAQGLGYKSQLKRDIEADYPPKTEIMPYWSNSSWRFDESESFSVDHGTIRKWGNAHNAAYVSYIEKALGVSIPARQTMNPADELDNVYDFLASDIGQAKLRAYRDQMFAKEKARRAKARAAASKPAKVS